jgi:hypothetical protein
MPPPSDKRRTVEDILSGSGGGINDIWDTVAPAGDDFDPLPPGVYRCIVTDGRVAESSTAKASYKVEFTIVEGPHASRKVWHDCWLTRDALHLAKRDLAKLRIFRPEQLKQPPPTGIVADVRVALSTRDDGSVLNRVAAFKVVADAPPPGTFDPDEGEGGTPDEGAAQEDDEVPF